VSYGSFLGFFFLDDTMSDSEEVSDVKAFVLKIKIYSVQRVKENREDKKGRIYMTEIRPSPIMYYCPGKHQNH
jgi:hypothetical protein